MQEENFKTSLPIQIRFNDIDAVGHINNNIYFSYFDLGKIRYFEQLKASSVSWTDSNIVIAHLDVDFISPIFYKESIVVDTKITSLGNKSGKFLQQIRNIHTGEIKCICKSVFVTYDIKTQASIAIPSEWREAVSQLEEITSLDNQSDSK